MIFPEYAYVACWDAPECARSGNYIRFRLPPKACIARIAAPYLFFWNQQT